MKVAPEVEKLMWTIADTHDKAAQENFEKLFPDLRNELLRRIRLVSEIKDAKSLHINPVVRPAFALKPTGKLRLSPKRAIYSSVLIVGAALAAAASYVAVARHNEQQVQAAIAANYICPPVPIQGGARFHTSGPSVSVRARPALTSPPAAVQQPAPSEPTAGVPVQAEPTPSSQAAQTPPASEEFPVYVSNSAPGSQAASPSPPPSNQPESQTAAESKALSTMTSPANRGKPMVIFRNAKLSTVIVAISHQYGVNISTATDMPNPEIDGEFVGDDASAVLNSIGTKYNFTVAKESRGHFLLVPGATASKHGPVKRF